MPSKQCFEEMRFFKEVQFSFQSIHFNKKVVVIYKLSFTSFQQEAQLAFMFESSTISLKNVTLLSKKHSCHLFGRNTICLKERLYSPKRKLNQLPLESYIINM